MSLHVFGYGSLIWRPGDDFKYVQRQIAYITGYKRRMWQVDPIHRGTVEDPGLVACLLPLDYREAHDYQYVQVDEAQSWGKTAIEHSHSRSNSEVGTNEDMLEAISESSSMDSCMSGEAASMPRSLSPHQGADATQKVFGLVYEVAEEHAESTLEYLRYRERCGYIDVRTTVCLTDGSTIDNVVVFVCDPNCSPVPVPLRESAIRIARCQGPSGPNIDYLLSLLRSLRNFSKSHWPLDSLYGSVGRNDGITEQDEPFLDHYLRQLELEVYAILNR